MFLIPIADSNTNTAVADAINSGIFKIISGFLSSAEMVVNFEVMVIDSIERLHVNRVCSMHDFDLAYNLKLLRKVGKIDSVRIIGVPMGIGEEGAMNQIQSILRKWAAQDMQGS